MNRKDWILGAVSVLVVTAVYILVGYLLRSQFLKAVATEVWANQPKVAAALSADEIAAEVLAKLPESASADEIAAEVAALMPASPEGQFTVNVDCCCPTATPPISATATITAPTATAPTATPTPVPCKDIYFKPGDEKSVPKGYIVAGDVDVWADGAWKPLYDNLEKTGLIVVTTAETKIRALWGADASNCHKLDNVKAGMITAGCSKGCDSVVIVNWPPN